MEHPARPQCVLKSEAAFGCVDLSEVCFTIASLMVKAEDKTDRRSSRGRYYKMQSVLMTGLWNV